MISLSTASGGVRVSLLVGACCALVMGAMAGCGEKKVERAPAAPPPPTYTGPEYLRNTVGSLARLREGDGEPLLVSNYGIVVFPPGTGTGSSEVPAYLRERMINVLRLRGIGSPKLAAQQPHLAPFLNMTPAEFLASRDTAVVEVQGLIPPGAVRGTPFDVVVSALPQTQTTSLAGGVLWTTELSVDGANPSLAFSRPLAEAFGPVYMNPFDEHHEGEADEQMRAGVVIAGGSATKPRRLDLVLNQPSWVRSRAIADRINERFSAAPGERIQTARAETDLLIHLAVPARFGTEPGMLLELVRNLYIDRGVGFEERKARELVKVLREQPSERRDVVAAWRALGKTVQTVLREVFENEAEPLELRLAALEAGAWLEDERAGRYLAELAQHPDWLVRARVAAATVFLPSSRAGGAPGYRSAPPALTALKQLLDDEDKRVRLTAYESLASIHDGSVLKRFAVKGRNGQVKFVIDQVPAEKPLVYFTQEDAPRVVIFGPDLGFAAPVVARLWNNRLMVRVDGENHAVKVYHQPRGRSGQVLEAYPSVATLAYLLGHGPRVEDEQEGLDLSYTEVVDALHRLCREGHIPAPVEVRVSQLAAEVAAAQTTQGGDFRPETSPVGEPVGAAGEKNAGEAAGS